jgi:K+-transporting ATPase c subunit
MALMSISELTGLTGDERAHLQAMEDAFQDVILAHAVTVSGTGLDAQLLARATVTLLLTLTARQAHQIAESCEEEVDSAAFAVLADGAFQWAISRASQAQNLLH